MSCNGSTGTGLTLALSVDSVIARIRAVQLPEWMGEAVDFSALDNLAFRCLKPGLIVEPGEMVAECIFDAIVGLPTLMLVQTATVTFPLSNAGSTTAGKLEGSGFIRSNALPNAAINEAMSNSFTFAFDGHDGPTLTLEQAGP